MSRRSDDAPVPAPAAPASTALPGRPDIDVVVPVLDEERTLEANLTRLHHFLRDEFPFSWRLTVADNGSTDGTADLAERLAGVLDGVRVLHVPERGRGRALKVAWSASDARVVAYMDEDLSTGLEALLPVVAPILSGHSEVVIGSRLVPGSRVARGPKRELISRSYNAIVRTLLRTHVHDAQCGFKAVRADVARALLPEVVDDDWFFDTELLVRARRRGLRIVEVPVDWVEEPDSRVDLVSTALDDLRGVARLVREPRGRR